MSEYENGSTPSTWPRELGPRALIGPAGRFVETIAPHSEASIAGLLVHYLVAAGNLMGTRTRAVVEGDEHPPRLYTGICGTTAAGRKGTAWSRVRQVTRGVDRAWADRVGGGLSSGEGPLWAVRDEIRKTIREKKNGKLTGSFVDVVEDPGIPDKRLLIVETELSRHFDVMTRAGNTLSETVRRFWDGGVVGSLTKNNPVRATDPHVSIIGHITREELRRKLTETESANGFANRFLWVAVRRRQELPFGGDLPDEDIQALQIDLLDAVSRVRRRNPAGLVLRFATHDDESTPPLGVDLEAESAAERWAAVYGDLSREREGLCGAICARAATQVLRLAVTYACLDVAERIELAHLEAALELWRYCAESAAWIFGDTTGDPLADAILQRLRRAGEDGMSRTDIREMVGGRVDAERIEAALGVLLLRRLAHFAEEETGGRRSQRWWAGQGAPAPTGASV